MAAGWEPFGADKDYVWLRRTLGSIAVPDPAQPGVGGAEMRTATGKVLTPEDLERLADEAEVGYDVEGLSLRDRPLRASFDKARDLSGVELVKRAQEGL